MGKTSAKSLWRGCLPLMVLLLLLLLAPGCSRFAPETVVEQFYTSWSEGDYGAMYALLDSASREEYSEEYFKERYRGISEGISLEKVEMGDPEKKESGAFEITFSLPTKLKTVLGTIPLNYEIVLAAKKGSLAVAVASGLIFPELDDHSRVVLDCERPRQVSSAIATASLSPAR